MPIYEYRCDECGKQIEVFGQTSEATLPPAQCSCGKPKSYSRLYSVFAAHGGPAGAAAEGECCGGAESFSHPCGGNCRCGHGH